MKTEIKWEDDDNSLEEEALRIKEKDLAGTHVAEGDFQTLLKQEKSFSQPIQVGEKVKGMISQVPTQGDDVLVDLGRKLTGIIDKSEFYDENGLLSCKVGDTIELYVVSRAPDEIILSKKMSQSVRNFDDMQRAYEQQIPVKGRVVKVNKGGFEIAILSHTAFCPISHIAAHFVQDGNEYLGKDFEFLIQKLDSRGRNIVVSRSALLRVAQEQKAKDIEKDLHLDKVFDGVVREVRDFGAFVDIGGIDGMVHISEISRVRVNKITDFIQKGDRVKVKVLKVDRDDKGRPKLSLSIKQAQADPWESIHEIVKQGGSYTGRVTRLMPFGAFIEIVPGIEGLLHVSEMSWQKRVHNPAEVVKIDDVVTVLVKEVNTIDQRISLSMKQIEDDPWFQAELKFPPGQAVHARIERLRHFGAMVELRSGLIGLLPLAVLKKKFGDGFKVHAIGGKEIDVLIVSISPSERRVLLTLPGIEADDAVDKDYLEFLEQEKQVVEQKAAEKNKEGAVGSFGELLAQRLRKN